GRHRPGASDRRRLRARPRRERRSPQPERRRRRVRPADSGGNLSAPRFGGSGMTEQPTALVIDDERQIRSLLRIVLEEDHYRVLDYDSGRQGLSEIASRRPDVVLLDLGLPDIDGLTVLRRLREWSHVPVLILSVRDGPEDK